MPSTSNFYGSNSCSPMRFPGSQLGSTPQPCGRRNGFTAVQMDTKFRTFTMIESDHEVRADPPSPWHSNLQVEDDHSPTVSVHLCTPPLRVDMRTDPQTTGFDPFNAVGNPGRPAAIRRDCRPGFSTHDPCAIAAADQMPNIDLFSTKSMPLVLRPTPPRQVVWMRKKVHLRLHPVT